MKKMRTVLAVAGLVLAMAPAARADATWTGGGDGINWSDNDNWNVADITVAGGVFTMTGSGSTTVDADTSTWTAITEVKAFSSSDTLNVGALATYQVNNHKPYGSIFIQTGGTVNITGIKSGNQGTTQISGGSYFANQWRQAYVYAPTAEVLHITGSATTSIQINVFLTQLYAGKDLPEISFTLDASGVTPLQVSAMGTAGNLDKLTINVDGLENYTGPNTPIPLVIDINSAIGVFDRVVAGTIPGGNGGILTLGTTTTTDDTIFLTMPYAVTYDGNGHNVGTPPTAQSKWYSVALTLASDIGTLEKTGYTFTGWNTAADGTGAAYALGASYTADAAVTLFAKWVTAVDDPFDNWLANLPAGQQSYDSDPDNDGIANLLEYAFGGDPTKTDQAIVMPTLDTSGGFLKLTFCHLKASLDPNLKYMPEISSSLKVAWSTDGLTTMGAPEGVLQDNLPDGKPFATSDYTRVTVTADKSMVEAVTKQFLRISVIRE